MEMLGGGERGKGRRYNGEGREEEIEKERTTKWSEKEREEGGEEGREEGRTVGNEEKRI